MTRGKAGAAVRSFSTRALLVKRVAYGESDLVVTLFTEELGRVSALARGAKNSRRRFGGALEPMHDLGVRLDERHGSDLVLLREASIARPRHRLVGDLDRLDAAGRALNWLRRAAPPRTAEPAAWLSVCWLLDELDAPEPYAPRVLLGQFGLLLLAAFGWGLELERCVRCGKPCPEGQSSMVAPERGGLVCKTCGGARRVLSAAQRVRLQRASRGAEPCALQPDDADVTLELVERALSVHAGID